MAEPPCTVNVPPVIDVALVRIDQALDDAPPTVELVVHAVGASADALARTRMSARDARGALVGVVQHPHLPGPPFVGALGMSMLPEEFPVVLTVFMAMGAWRISLHRCGDS